MASSQVRHVALLGVDSRLPELLMVGDEPVWVMDTPTKHWSVQAVSEPRSRQQSATYRVHLIAIESPDAASIVPSESVSLSTALQLSDGALVVLDCSTSTLDKRIANQLRRIAALRVTPTLVLDVTGEAWRSVLQRPLEETYQAFKRLIDVANEILAACGHGESGSDNGLTQTTQVSASAGSVAFVSSELGWGFTVPTFARSLAARFDTDETSVAERLWGDWGLDPITEQWASPSPPGVARGFCQFILEPLVQLAHSLEHCDGPIAGDGADFERILADQGVSYAPEDLLLHTDERLLSRVFQKWLPISNALMTMMVDRLPSPLPAQPHLDTSTLAASTEADKVTEPMIERGHRSESLVVMLASEVELLDSDGPRRVFKVFGRVLAGCVITGQRMHFTRYRTADDTTYVSTDYAKALVCTMKVRGSLRIGSQAVDTIPAGHIGSFTCEPDIEIPVSTSLDLPPAIKETVEARKNTVQLLESAASPVLCVTVLPEMKFDGSSHWIDLSSQILKATQQIASQDPTLSVLTSVFTDPQLAAPDERHLQAALSEVRAACSALGLAISITKPRPVYREASTSATTPRPAPPRVSKSPNRINRVYSYASTLTEDAASTWLGQPLTGFDRTRALELTSSQVNDLQRTLKTDLHSTKEDPKTAWAFFPSPGAVNLLVDHSRGVVQSHPSILRGVVGALAAGVLCFEPSHNLRVDFADISVHAQPRRRHPNQLLLAARRAVYAAQLSSNPVLQEPVYLVRITGSHPIVRAALRAELEDREATGISDQQDQDANALVIRAYVPVRNALGLHAAVREATSGLATVCCVFDHYRTVPGDPLDANSIAGKVVRAVRLEKDLPPDVPSLDTFDDSKPRTRVVESHSST